MEEIGGNIFATPKCGINFVRGLRPLFNIPGPPAPIGAWFVRNPYARTVSYFVNKIVYQCIDPRSYDISGLIKKVSTDTDNRGSELWSTCALSASAKGIQNWTFAEFVRWLSVQDNAAIERHLRSQYRPPKEPPRDVQPQNMHIFKIENLDNEVPRLAKVFLLSEQAVKSRLLEAMARSNKTPRSPCISTVFDLDPKTLRTPINPYVINHQRHRYNIPKCTVNYYNDEIADLVYNYYKKDFELCGYDRDSYKAECKCNETPI